MPYAEPTGEMHARALRPPSHKDMLCGCRTAARTQLEGSTLPDCLWAQMVLPFRWGDIIQRSKFRGLACHPHSLGCMRQFEGS